MPGQTPRPPETLFAPLKAGIGPHLRIDELAESRCFQAGREAFAARYYWEAHELWEAIWMALPPQSAERVFLRGLIQLANAGLKVRMGRQQAALRILSLADAALCEAMTRCAPGRAEGLMGLTLQEVGTMRALATGDSI